MTDCPNAEMRDRLPDLLHERLDASARAVIMAHIEQCGDCRAEFMVLREARLALSSDVRAVDVTSIARVVIARTAAPAAMKTTPRRSRSPWMDWRVAASIALLAVGGASLAIIRERQQPVAALPATVTAPVPASIPQQVATDTERRPSRATPTAVAPATAELSAAGGVSDLSDSDLRALLDDLQSIDAMPSTEPEPVTVRVAVPASGSIE